MVSFTDQQKKNLRCLAAGEILDGHNEAWAYLTKKPKPTKQYEPVFTAYLCLSLSRLASKWRNELQQTNPSVKLSITSVFTHQKPYVTYGSGPIKCELSDVMLVLIDRSDLSNTVANALFIQAKRDDSWKLKLSSPRDLNQLTLYVDKPPFSVQHSFAPKEIQFPIAKPDTGLNYGITPPTNINSKPALDAWGSDRWKIANGMLPHTGNIIDANTPIQDLLVDFLDGSAGLPFELCNDRDDWQVFDKPGKKWSALINFILQGSLHCASQSYIQPVLADRSMGEDNLYFAMRDKDGIPSTTINFSPSALSTHQFSDKALSNFFQHDHYNRKPPVSPPPSETDGGDDQWGGMSVVVMEKSIERG